MTGLLGAYWLRIEAIGDHPIPIGHALSILSATGVVPTDWSARRPDPDLPPWGCRYPDHLPAGADQLALGLSDDRELYLYVGPFKISAAGGPFEGPPSGTPVYKVLERCLAVFPSIEENLAVTFRFRVPTTRPLDWLPALPGVRYADGSVARAAAARLVLYFGGAASTPGPRVTISTVTEEASASDHVDHERGDTLDCEIDWGLYGLWIGAGTQAGESPLAAALQQLDEVAGPARDFLGDTLSQLGVTGSKEP